MIVHGLDAGPHTSPGRMIVVAISPGGLSGQHDMLGVHLGVHVAVSTDPHGVVLGDAVGKIEPVGGDRRDVHEPRHTGGDRRPQNPLSAKHIDLPRGIQRRGVGHHCGGVDHDVDTGELPCPRCRVDGAARDDPVSRGGDEVDTSHRGAEFTQSGRQGAGDEAVRARDEDGGGQWRRRSFGHDGIHDGDDSHAAGRTGISAGVRPRQLSAMAALASSDGVTLRQSNGTSEVVPRSGPEQTTMADIVLINPRFEASYWGLEHALPFWANEPTCPWPACRSWPPWCPATTGSR